MNKLLYICVLSALSLSVQAETYQEKLQRIDSKLSNAKANPTAFRSKATSSAKLFSPNSLSGDYVAGSTVSASVENAYCDTTVNYPKIKIRININPKDQGRAGLVYLGYTNANQSNGWYLDGGGNPTSAGSNFAPYVAVLPAGGSVSIEMGLPGYDVINMGVYEPLKIYAGYGILTDQDEATIQARIKHEKDLDARIKDVKNNKDPRQIEINNRLIMQRANSAKFDPASARRSAIESNMMNEHKAQYVAVNTSYEGLCRPLDDKN